MTAGWITGFPLLRLVSSTLRASRMPGKTGRSMLAMRRVSPAGSAASFTSSTRWRIVTPRFPWLRAANGSVEVSATVGTLAGPLSSVMTFRTCSAPPVPPGMTTIA